MTDERRRVVTLTKAQCATPEGTELIALLTELSADGIVSRQEMAQLRTWLEVDRGVDFPALPFLYRVIDEISEDAEISEEELDRLALAIERVLPKNVREDGALRRKQAREARRLAERESRRQAVMAQRTDARARRDLAHARAGILYRAEFPVRGAFRFAARREACERLTDGDSVSLEREPDNSHDPNAILVLGENDCELGYVGREEAADMAPLLDSGAQAEATVSRLWETPEGQIVPILLVKVRRGDSGLSRLQPTDGRRSSRQSATTKESGNSPGCGYLSAACLAVFLAICFAAIAAG